MNAFVLAAEWFIGLFKAGGDVFVSLVVGIVPLLIVLLTFVNALVALIGPDKIDNPMAYTMGRFLPEKYKPAFYDSAVSYVHPPLGIFPHINPGELFVWLGIAAGIEALGYSVVPLAVWYLIVGLIVIFIRGIVTERITAVMWARREAS